MDEPLHIEMYDGSVFCGAEDYNYDGVRQEDWHDHPVALTKATCIPCLHRVAELGQRAGDRAHSLTLLKHGQPTRDGKTTTTTSLDEMFRMAREVKP